MGLILPSSLMFADYARPLRDAIRQNFARTTLVRLKYQTFFNEGADERAVVLLTEGFGSSAEGDWMELTATSERDGLTSQAS